MDAIFITLTVFVTLLAALVARLYWLLAVQRAQVDQLTRYVISHDHRLQKLDGIADDGITDIRHVMVFGPKRDSERGNT
jgi:hypothetical protein